jgi:hypothetical protein
MVEYNAPLYQPVRADRRSLRGLDPLIREM